MSAPAHADLAHEVNCLYDKLAQNLSALEGVQMRLQTLEQQQPRMKGQLDILNRILHPSVQAYLRSHVSVTDMVLT